MLLRNKIADRVTRGTIIFASTITIFVLVLIVGYTIFRGLYSNTVSKWDVIPGTEDSIEIEGNEYFIVVNNSLKLKEISIETLLNIKRGRNRNWGLITGQDLPIKIFNLINDPLVVTDKSTKEKNSSYLISSVSRTKGAIGFVPVKDGSDIKDVKLVGIRRIVLAVNQSVLKTVDNRRLREVKSDFVGSILKGEFDNWKELGGIDLQLRIIIPPESETTFNGVNMLYNEVLYRSVNSIHTTNSKDFFRLLKSTEGAVAPVDYLVAKDMGLETLKLIQHDSGKNLTLDYLLKAPKKSGRVGGVSTIILNTLIMIVLTLILTVPVGIGAAIYLTMYSKAGRLNDIIRTGVETLAGVPSIIFGLFGFIVFVEIMGLGMGMISGTLTISLMILPTIIRSAEEGIKTVPDSFYAGSLALGASKWQSISRVIVPAASPGIISGIILAMGRAVGETAALLFTMGSDYRLVSDLTSSARVLSVHLYLLVKEGISFEKGFATATILIVVILIMNLTTTLVISRIGGKGERRFSSR